MRLIDADALVKEISDWYEQCGGTTDPADDIIRNVLCAVNDDIDEAETVDAAPVRHGKWIKEEDGYGLCICKCSMCHEEWCFDDDVDVEDLNYHYCPNCGAKMDGGTEDENA